MVTIIDGQTLAEQVKDEIVQAIIALNQGERYCPQRRPNLAIILVGNREDSKLYVDKKESEAKKVGIDTHVYRCPADIPEREVFEMIDFLNKDEKVDAILVQLPLPDGFDTDGIIRAMDPKKDVDRFHPDNLEILLKTCDHRHVMPPVFKSVLKMLDSINYETKDKQVCIVSNSDIFGRSLAKTLECQGAICEMVRPDDPDLARKTVLADVLITAVGQAGLITETMVADDAVVIDIGISKEGKKVYGDVDFAGVKGKCAAITPVPGGVGPLTIAMLFANTLELYRAKCE